MRTLRHPMGFTVNFDSDAMTASETAAGYVFTPAVRDSWVACYGVLSKEMKEAAASA